MKMVISQRLAKKICQNCKVEDNLSESKIEKVKNYLKPIVDKNTLENLKFYK
jgi:type II secretory ATPase GspE/PulE/Tfp pilus assembly ATPase PilB-like protein